MTIRAATPADAEGIAAVHVASIRGLASQQYPPALVESWSSGKHPNNYRQALANGELMFVAQRADGQIVGFSSSQGAEVRAVYVDPAHARLGIGSRLLRAVEQQAVAQGQTRLELTSSLNAVPFYATHGFVEQQRVRLRLRAGGELDGVEMTKSLPPDDR